MSRLLLTLFCSTQDSEAIAMALRDFAERPVHIRPEMVLGRDFDDAGTSERVAGTLTRSSVEVELTEDQVSAAIGVATNVRRRLPFRWRTTQILDGGRVS